MGPRYPKSARELTHGCTYLKFYSKRLLFAIFGNAENEEEVSLFLFVDLRGKKAPFVTLEFDGKYVIRSIKEETQGKEIVRVFTQNETTDLYTCRTFIGSIETMIETSFVNARPDPGDS